MYSREIDGQVLTIASSGWTYESLFVLWDYETESIWYDLWEQEGLTAIAGEYADAVLPKYESRLTRWHNWKEHHPDTKFLDY